MKVLMALALVTGSLPACASPAPTIDIERVVASPVASKPPPRNAGTRPGPSGRLPSHSVPAGPRSHEAVVLDVFGAKWGPSAARVADCESGGDETPGREPITIHPEAKNGVHLGAFQLSKRWHLERAARLGFEWEDMAKIRPNAIVALDLFVEKDHSFEPPNGWTCAWAA